jgi:hypothetical protein
VIGFSLGAEAAGVAGKVLKNRGIQLGRITGNSKVVGSDPIAFVHSRLILVHFGYRPTFLSGLDPAFPLYNLIGRQGRLSSGDALFVDVIHTNAGIFGYPTPIGDVDFYPNPGSPIQPGCLPQDLFKRKLLDRMGIHVYRIRNLLNISPRV